MNNQLFIPKRIKAGFQERNDCFCKKISYISYFDAKGIFRKEASWEGWRDKKIAPEEFDNIPTEGFVLNKGIRRDWSHFSSGRSMIRIYDPRGLEFEITVDNLTYLLMHDDCIKRGFEGKYIYSWFGKDLILLPCSSEQYKKSQEYTELQAKKISAKELVAGRSYKTKDQTDLVYIGRYLWYQWGKHVLSYAKTGLSRAGQKRHIFHNSKGFFLYLDNLGKLAVENSEQLVDNFAGLVDKFKNDRRAKKVIKYEVRQTDQIFDASFIPDPNRYNLYCDDKKKCRQNKFFTLENNILCEYRLGVNTSYDLTNRKDLIKNYYLHQSFRIDVETEKTLETETVQSPKYYSYSSTYAVTKSVQLNSLEDIKNNFGDLWITFETGETKKIDSLSDL